MKNELYLRSLLFRDPPEDFYRPWRLPAPFYTFTAPRWVGLGTGIALVVVAGGTMALWLF